MIVRKTLDISKPLTAEQRAMLEALADAPAVPDEDCPELTPEQLKEMYRVSDRKSGERRKRW